VAANLKAKNGSVGIRIVQDEFCRKLLERFGKPIVSTSANMSGSPSPKKFKEIDQVILEGVDHIVTLKTKETRTRPSTIVLIDADGNLKTLRA
jgi:L-threonylcarbamoyladenylate synthase